MKMDFQVDPRILEESFHVTDLELSKIFLKNDKENPWFILVPKKNNKFDIIDLNSEDQYLLTEEIVLVSNFLREYYRPYKINVANLGNVVRQLHLHIIARYENDKAWPNPIWGSVATETFEIAELENIKSNFLEFIL
jgi:diadenosine tetraphosphate (Ap4A) HIT family hydrolase